MILVNIRLLVSQSLNGIQLRSEPWQNIGEQWITLHCLPKFVDHGFDHRLMYNQ